MKFVIKSLLFVNLLLQMTGALRKCFNQDQNLMLTIILLAFSLIGIIGLTVGNRFILIIFAACMTLILIASITIYAIGRTEPDASKPKVPYYSNSPLHAADGSSSADQSRTNRMKSFVNKLLNRNQQPNDNAAKPKRLRNNKPRPQTQSGDQDSPGVTRRTATARRPSLPLASQTIDDYSDEPNGGGVVHLLLSPQDTDLPVARSGLDESTAGGQLPIAQLDSTGKLSRDRTQQQQEVAPASVVGAASQAVGDESNMIQSQQWVVYERRLYERYLEIVSQSIDLIMLTILASWMALLLDEESDQCFGSGGTGSRGARGKVHAGSADGKQEAPIYNYNGVRYSIKPGDEAADSPSRVVVR